MNLHSAFTLLTSLVVSTVLVACSSSSSGPAVVNLTGTAATGAAFVGTLNILDSTGENIDNIPVEIDGTFTVDVGVLTPPLMLQAVPSDPAEATLYSYISADDITPGTTSARVNITPLTSLSMFIATGVNTQAELDSYFSSWSTNSGTFSDADLLDAQATINANLQTQFGNNGVDHTTYDFFGTAFSADGTGIDAVLDAIDVDLSSGIDVGVGGSPGFMFDDMIDTTGIDIGGGSNTTTYTVGGTVSNATGTVVLALNGGPNLDATDTTFVFPTELNDNAVYQVTVEASPAGQTCTVSSGSGVIAADNVTDVLITCTPTGGGSTYTVGGSITGATSAFTIQLSRNGGVVETIPNILDSSYGFTEEFDATDTYLVEVTVQPSGETCIVSNSSGTIADDDITADISCSSGINGGTPTSATVSVMPTGFFDLDNNTTSSSYTADMDFGSTTNEGVNFGSENTGIGGITTRRLQLLAQSGTLDAIPPPGAWSDASPWVFNSWDFTDGTGGLPIEVGQLWAVYTSDNEMAVMRITGFTGTPPFNVTSFDFDFVILP